MQTWTIQKLLNWITEYFTEKNVDSPRFSAELLLGYVLDIDRIVLYTDFDKAVSKPHLDKLHSLVKRCTENEPLAYLIGSTEFYSITMKVSPDCLIPRPETELLVERAIEFLRSRDNEQFICDLCTGSGCIAVAIAKNVPTANCIATDICEKALSIAAQNVEHYQLADRVKLLSGDLFAPIIEGLDSTQFDLIISNPPYVTTDEYEKLDKNVKDYEPRSALIAGADGLDIYRRLIEKVPHFLKPGGKLILEIGYTQAEDVKELLQNTNCFNEIISEKDFAKNDRIIIATKTES